MTGLKLSHGVGLNNQAKQKSTPQKNASKCRHRAHGFTFTHHKTFFQKTHKLFKVYLEGKFGMYLLKK